jgi:hypothetical protein
LFISTSIRNLVAGRFQRAGAAPTPDQDDFLVRGVVKTVPVFSLRKYNVTFNGRLFALVRVDDAPAFENQQELVGPEMAMAAAARGTGEPILRPNSSTSNMSFC